MDKTPPLPAHEVRPEFEYVYHWHRIIPAVASLAIGIGTVLWFWPSSIPGQEGASASHEVPPALKTGENPSVVVNVPVKIDKAITGVPSTQTPANTAASSGVTVSEATTPVVKSSGKPEAPAKNDTPSTAPLAKTTIEKRIVEPPAPTAGIKPGQVIVAKNAATIVTLRQIIDQAPIELNKGAIGLTKKKAVKVVFSANTGKPDQQVNYFWYLNGKLQAQVTTKSSPESSTMGSKYISYDTPGLWQVKITDEAGKVLAESAFAAKRVE